MTIKTKTKYHFKPVLFQFMPDLRLLISKPLKVTNGSTQQDQIEISVSVKNAVLITFMCPIVKVFHL